MAIDNWSDALADVEQVHAAAHEMWLSFKCSNELILRIALELISDTITRDLALKPILRNGKDREQLLDAIKVKIPLAKCIKEESELHTLIASVDEAKKEIQEQENRKDVKKENPPCDDCRRVPVLEKLLEESDQKCQALVLEKDKAEQNLMVARRKFSSVEKQMEVEHESKDKEIKGVKDNLAKMTAEKKVQLDLANSEMDRNSKRWGQKIEELKQGRAEKARIAKDYQEKFTKIESVVKEITSQNRKAKQELEIEKTKEYGKQVTNLKNELTKLSTELERTKSNQKIEIDDLNTKFQMNMDTYSKKRDRDIDDLLKRKEREAEDLIRKKDKEHTDSVRKLEREITDVLRRKDREVEDMKRMKEREYDELLKQREKKEEGKTRKRNLEVRKVEDQAEDRLKQENRKFRSKEEEFQQALQRKETQLAEELRSRDKQFEEDRRRLIGQKDEELERLRIKLEDEMNNRVNTLQEEINYNRNNFIMRLESCDKNYKNSIQLIEKDRLEEKKEYQKELKRLKDRHAKILEQKERDFKETLDARVLSEVAATCNLDESLDDKTPCDKESVPSPKKKGFKPKAKAKRISVPTIPPTIPITYGPQNGRERKEIKQLRAQITESDKKYEILQQQMIEKERLLRLEFDNALQSAQKALQQEVSDEILDDSNPKLDVLKSMNALLKRQKHQLTVDKQLYKERLDSQVKGMENEIKDLERQLLKQRDIEEQLCQSVDSEFRDIEAEKQCLEEQRVTLTKWNAQTLDARDQLEEQKEDFDTYVQEQHNKLEVVRTQTTFYKSTQELDKLTQQVDNRKAQAAKEQARVEELSKLVETLYEQKERVEREIESAKGVEESMRKSWACMESSKFFTLADAARTMPAWAPFLSISDESKIGQSGSEVPTEKSPKKNSTMNSPSKAANSKMKYGPSNTMIEWASSNTMVECAPSNTMIDWAPSSTKIECAPTSAESWCAPYAKVERAPTNTMVDWAPNADVKQDEYAHATAEKDQLILEINELARQKEEITENCAKERADACERAYKLREQVELDIRRILEQKKMSEEIALALGSDINRIQEQKESLADDVARMLEEKKQLENDIEIARTTMQSFGHMTHFHLTGMTMQSMKEGDASTLNNTFQINPTEDSCAEPSFNKSQSTHFRSKSFGESRSRQPAARRGRCDPGETRSMLLSGKRLQWGKSRSTRPVTAPAHTEFIPRARTISPSRNMLSQIAEGQNIPPPPVDVGTNTIDEISIEFKDAAINTIDEVEPTVVEVFPEKVDQDNQYEAEEIVSEVIHDTIPNDEVLDILLEDLLSQPKDVIESIRVSAPYQSKEPLPLENFPELPEEDEPVPVPILPNGRIRVPLPARMSRKKNQPDQKQTVSEHKPRILIPQEADDPVESSDEPVEPSDDPVASSDHPAEQSDASIEPSDHPVESSDHPLEPSDHSMEPSDHSMEPSDQIIEPSDHPMEPSDHPVEPSDEHEESEENPVDRAAAEVESPDPSVKSPDHPVEPSDESVTPPNEVVEPTPELTACKTPEIQEPVKKEIETTEAPTVEPSGLTIEPSESISPPSLEETEDDWEGSGAVGNEFRFPTFMNCGDEPGRGVFNNFQASKKSYGDGWHGDTGRHAPWVQSSTSELKKEICQLMSERDSWMDKYHQLVEDKSNKPIRDLVQKLEIELHKSNKNERRLIYENQKLLTATDEFRLRIRSMHTIAEEMDEYHEPPPNNSTFLREAFTKAGLNTLFGKSFKVQAWVDRLYRDFWKRSERLADLQEKKTVEFKQLEELREMARNPNQETVERYGLPQLPFKSSKLWETPYLKITESIPIHQTMPRRSEYNASTRHRMSDPTAFQKQRSVRKNSDSPTRQRSVRRNEENFPQSHRMHDTFPVSHERNDTLEPLPDNGRSSYLPGHNMQGKVSSRIDTVRSSHPSQRSLQKNGRSDDERSFNQLHESNEYSCRSSQKNGFFKGEKLSYQKTYDNQRIGSKGSCTTLATEDDRNGSKNSCVPQSGDDTFREAWDELSQSPNPDWQQDGETRSWMEERIQSTPEWEDPQRSTPFLGTFIDNHNKKQQEVILGWEHRHKSSPSKERSSDKKGSKKIPGSDDPYPFPTKKDKKSNMEWNNPLSSSWNPPKGEKNECFWSSTESQHNEWSDDKPKKDLHQWGHVPQQSSHPLRSTDSTQTLDGRSTCGTECVSIPSEDLQWNDPPSSHLGSSHFGSKGKDDKKKRLKDSLDHPLDQLQWNNGLNDKNTSLNGGWR